MRRQKSASGNNQLKARRNTGESVSARYKGYVEQQPEPIFDIAGSNWMKLTRQRSVLKATAHGYSAELKFLTQFVKREKGARFIKVPIQHGDSPVTASWVQIKSNTRVAR